MKKTPYTNDQVETKPELNVDLKIGQMQTINLNDEIKIVVYVDYLGNVHTKRYCKHISWVEA